MKHKVQPTLIKAGVPNSNAVEWIDKLQLAAHPEGGWFKETYRSKEQIDRKRLPNRFSDSRNFSTAIYYLLEQGDFSAFHRIKSDEIWHFYDGEPLEIIEITQQGELIKHCLGLSLTLDCHPQVVISAENWFAAHPLGAFTLVGCTVSPGFDFADFEMSTKPQLTKLFPEHQSIIEKFCK